MRINRQYLGGADRATAVFEDLEAGKTYTLAELNAALAADAEARRRLADALRRSILNHCADDRLYCSTCSPARSLLVELGEDAP